MSSQPVGAPVKGGGQMTDLPALNSAVAGVLGMKEIPGTGWYHEEESGTAIHPALDWNALMAAVKVLEKKHYFFDRDSGDGAWRVDKREWSATFYFGFDGSGDVSRDGQVRGEERDALARCIHAAV